MVKPEREPTPPKTLSAMIVIIVALNSGTTVYSSEEPTTGADGKAMLERRIMTLAHGNAADRMAAARRLGMMRCEAAVPGLICALEDPNQAVRGWSAWALAEIGDEAAIDPLITAMEKYSVLLFDDPFLEQTKCLADFDAALKKLTHQDFGLDTGRWRKWKQEHDKEKSAPAK